MNRVSARLAASLGLSAFALLAALSEPPGTSTPALPPPATDLFYQDISWSPDSGLIAASEYAGPKEVDPTKWSIQLIPVNGSSPRTLINNAMWVSWAPDGKRLAFASSRDGNWEIYSAKPDGSDLQRLTDNPASDSQPAWSPTNTRIAFVSNRDGKRHIYTMSPDGSAVRQLTKGDADDANPAWSRSGASIVFYRERGDNKDQIFVIEADGTGERCVSDKEFHNTFPSFLADGRVAFRRGKGEGPRSIVVLDTTLNESTPFGPAEAWFARWAPNGRHVAFIAGSWPRSAVYTAYKDGTQIKKIAN